MAEPFTLIAADSRPWASATFEGARHRLALALEGDDANARATRIETMLAEADLPMAGSFVADIVVVVEAKNAQPMLAIEALTIDEA